MYKQCAQLIKEAKLIGVLTGAGISTKAGIPDFRGPNGLYVTRRYDPDKVFDINHFYHDPKPFFEFARDFLTLENKIQPTLSHKFFAQLEKSGKLAGVVTQNIDSLHQLAGSKKVFEMHGSFWKSFCLNCRKEYSFEEMKRKVLKEEIPRCSCQGVIKPDIVFFGENVKYLAESADLASQCDLFFVIGTSCVVYPAASIPSYVPGKVVIVNLSPIEINLFNIVLETREDIDEFFSKVQTHL